MFVVKQGYEHSLKRTGFEEESLVFEASRIPDILSEHECTLGKFLR
jgi:hypothetical protein